MIRSILITGGAGFIGSHLTDHLLSMGHRVTVFDDFSSGSKANLENSLSRVNLIEDDVRNLATHIGTIGPVDTIVHLAALISGNDSLRQPRDYLGVNVDGTLAVIDASRALGCSRIIFASSSTVYGGTPCAEKSELDTPVPLTPYALSKLTSEHLLSMYASVAGYTHTSLRLFNVYGPRQKPDHPYANVTCKFSHAAANGRGVFLYGDGEQTRDFVFVSDVVAAFARSLEPTSSHVYNVGTGKDVSINALIGLAGEIAGRPLDVEPRDVWENDIREIRANTAKCAGELGFRAEVALREGLEETIAFFRRLR